MPPQQATFRSGFSFVENNNFVIVYLNYDFIKGNLLYLYNNENDQNNLYNIRLFKKSTNAEYRSYIQFDIIFSINKMENDSAIDSATLKTIEDQTNATISSTFTDEYKNQIGANAVASTIQSYQNNIGQLNAAISSNTGVDANTYCNSGSVAEGLQGYCAQYISLNKMVNELNNPNSVLYSTIYSTAVATAMQTASATATSVSSKVAIQVAESAKQKTLTSLKELNQNISKINNGLKSVTDGVNSLNSGAKELSQGMEQFNNEGISKIANFVDNDLKNSTEKVKKLQQLAKEYKSFTNISKDAKGNTKFILVIDGQKVKEKKIKTTKKEKKETVGDRILNLFE